jgi:hypothetical protein
MLTVVRQRMYQAMSPLRSYTVLLQGASVEFQRTPDSQTDLLWQNPRQTNLQPILRIAKNVRKREDNVLKRKGRNMP